MRRIRVMIVDDSALVRETISNIVTSDPQIELFATAPDPIVAMRKMETERPDVIILDIEMPRMDGLTFLSRLMTENPLPVIICSSKSETGSSNALKAMEYGAVEIIQKPKLGTKQFLEESKVTITDAVKAASQARLKARGRAGGPPAGGPGEEPAAGAGPKVSPRGQPAATTPATEAPAAQRERYAKHTADVIMPAAAGNYTIETTEKVVVVGASTGGTEALKVFLEMMPINAPPIVIVQHMPEKFTSAFAQRLNGYCRIQVKEAANNDSVLRGQALIAPGNRHTLLKRSGARYYTEVKEGPLVSRHRPSVDVLFRSASRYGGKNVVAVLMTGMGDDGASGMLELKQAGAYTIAQDEKSCVVFGMPKEAIKRGGVDTVVALEKIAETILEKAKN